MPIETLRRMLPSNYAGILTSGYSPYFHPSLSPRPRDSVFGPSYLESANALSIIDLQLSTVCLARLAFEHLTVQLTAAV